MAIATTIRARAREVPHTARSAISVVDGLLQLKPKALELRNQLLLVRLRKILQHLAQWREQFGQQLAHELLALFGDTQHHAAPVVDAQDARDEAAADQAHR